MEWNEDGVRMGYERHKEQENTQITSHRVTLTVCLGHRLAAIGSAIGANLGRGLHIPAGGVRLRETHRMELELVRGTHRVAHLLRLETLEVLIQQRIPMAGGQRILAEAGQAVAIGFRHAYQAVRNALRLVTIEIPQTRFPQLVQMRTDLLLTLGIFRLLPL